MSVKYTPEELYKYTPEELYNMASEILSEKVYFKNAYPPIDIIASDYDWTTPVDIIGRR